VLGELPGFFNGGQLHRMWQALAEDWPCGSGEPVRRSEFWGAALERGFGGVDRLDVAHMPHLAQHAALNGSARHLPGMLRGTPSYPGAAEHQGMLRSLYEGIAATAGASVIVDTSKSPTYLARLRAAGVGDI
jgi:hypothetical protein